MNAVLRSTFLQSSTRNQRFFTRSSFSSSSSLWQKHHHPCSDHNSNNNHDRRHHHLDRNIEMKFPSGAIGQLFVTASILAAASHTTTTRTTVRAFTTTTTTVPKSFTRRQGQQQMTPPAAAVGATASSSSDTTNIVDTTTTMTSLSNYVMDRLDNSWIHQLSSETDQNYQKSTRMVGLSANTNDNRTKRPIFNGHYVLVEPEGLRNPRLVLVSDDVATNLLKLQSHHIESPEFVQWISGNGLGTDGDSSASDSLGWATPYALSIVGTRYTSNCPYGTGVGYGDGRAISIAEFNGYELQLKGGGPTPFCRGADGRAVLRSSIREFLASEAMHFLGIRTTRALSLVTSEGQTVPRPWYQEGTQLQIPAEDDPRLASYSAAEKKVVLQQLRQRKADPNVMIQEPCAITCRVAPSFVRVGHVDLHARRVVQESQQQQTPPSPPQTKNKDIQKNNRSTNQIMKYDTSTLCFQELKDMVWHACYREYKHDAYDPYINQDEDILAFTKLLECSCDRLATMVTQWVRVGFAQGNFNADNCLVGGHTMDYGPFGFMDEYSPLFAKWTGSGQHFGFLNQPSAGLANYQVLVESVVPLIVASEEQKAHDDHDEDFDADEREEELVEHFMNKAQGVFQTKVDDTFRSKMGLSSSESSRSSRSTDDEDDLWDTLEPLMRSTRVDWTLFWRQLSYMVDQFPKESQDYSGMLDAMMGDTTTNPFYESLSSEHRTAYEHWIQEWRKALRDEPDDLSVIGDRMKQVNPKYVLREWMLVDAYTAAAKGDESILQGLFELIKRPYEEGTPEEQTQYYARAHDSALTAGGTAFMS